MEVREVVEVTISLPEDVEKELRKQAEEREKSISEQVEFLINYYSEGGLTPIPDEERRKFIEKLKKLRSVSRPQPR